MVQISKGTSFRTDLARYGVLILWTQNYLMLFHVLRSKFQERETHKFILKTLLLSQT